MQTLGWRGKLVYLREWWNGMQMESAKQRIQLQKAGGASAMIAKLNHHPERETKLWQPGGALGDSFRRLVMQVVTPPPERDGTKPDRWLTVMELGGSCMLSGIDGSIGEGISALLEISDTPPLDKIELELLTSVDAAEVPHVTTTTVIYARDGSSNATPVDAAAAAPADARKSDADASAETLLASGPAAAPAAAPEAAAIEAADDAEPGITSFSGSVAWGLTELLTSAPAKLCCTHIPDPLDDPVELKEGVYGPEEEVRLLLLLLRRYDSLLCTLARARSLDHL